ncbi:hypothetical protein CRE_04957 [Caenorhabditis remanei]|uniref:Uncharacterized protein n=1 Tax=Caenorhabditis remanei TaxID=31234 RepID=E3MN62_CAERE|nr:hypothetical protein CRE_04957 [Caenorhabditis remanei]
MSAKPFETETIESISFAVGEALALLIIWVIYMIGKLYLRIVYYIKSRSAAEPAVKLSGKSVDVHSVESINLDDEKKDIKEERGRFVLTIPVTPAVKGDEYIYV